MSGLLLETHMVQRFIFLICVFTSVAAAQSAAPPRKNIQSIAKAADRAIVSIVMSDKDGKPIAQGSGFFASKDGLVVTNYHVIAEGTSAVLDIPVSDGDGWQERVPVDGVVAFDKKRDIAVIKTDGHNFRTLTLGNSDRVRVGEEVVAIGNPLSLESTVSNGIVSGVRTIEELGGRFLQITAPISPGSSGGPLFNMAGEVVGITTAGLKGGENLNFAIPINDVKPLLATAEDHRTESFPNESERKEVPPEGIHAKATLLEQKMCSEQAEQILHEQQLHAEQLHEQSFKAANQPIFNEANHYDALSGICYVKILIRYYFVGESYPPIKTIFIEDAFGKGKVGILLSPTTPGDLLQHAPLKSCIIRPPGQPEIDCKSEAEFDDLALKYFGIQK